MSEEFYGSIDDLPCGPTPLAMCGDWLRERSYNLLYARAGIGKTAFAAELVYAIKTGNLFMGQLTHDLGPVLWVNGDLPDWQVKQRLGYLAPYVDLWHLEHGDLTKQYPKLIERCEDYSLVIFDNRPALFQLMEVMSPEAWDTINRKMRQICETTAVLMMVHEGKGEGTSSFGSSAQEWVTDNIIRMSPRVPTEKEEAQYKKKGDYTLPTGKIQWKKSRLSSVPEDIEFRLSYEAHQARLNLVWIPN